jgi:hypothetical protein
VLQLSAPAFFISSYVYDEQKFHEVLGSFTAWILYMAQVLTIGVYCSLDHLPHFELYVQQEKETRRGEGLIKRRKDIGGSKQAR